MRLTIVDAGLALRARTLSSEELLNQVSAIADAHDERLGVYLRRFDESAIVAARAADKELAQGIDRGPLHGIPIGVKDIVATREGPTTGNSLVEYPTWHAARDATVIARLRAGGAVITGKLTAMEFAIGVPDKTKNLPVPRNPWDLDRYPGGSSSGSGSGVAAGMFLGSVGTDTAGSIRIPAAYCGVSGLKGTYGSVSNNGVIPLGPSLDVVGPLAQTAADVALMHEVMVGFDPCEPSSIKVDPPDVPVGSDQSLRGVRIGVERRNHLYGELVDPEMPSLFEEAVSMLERAGATVCEVEIRHYREITDSVLLTMFAEGLAHHQRALREQWDLFGSSARLAFAGASVFSAHEYITAQKVRRLGRRVVNEVFASVDLIVCPTTATGAPLLEGLDLSRIISTLFTNIWSGVGGPAISVPMGFNSHGLPFGLQIAGRPFEDGLVLRAAEAFQRVTDWHAQPPPTPPKLGAPEEELGGGCFA